MAGTLSIISPDETVSNGSIDLVGVVDESASPLSRSYTLLNDGDDSLTISDVQAGGDITITDDPTDDVVAALASTTLTLSLDVSEPGTHEQQVSVLHTGDGSPYDITVRWQVAAGVSLTSRMKRSLKRLCCDRAASEEVIDAISSGIPTSLSGRAKRALSTGSARHQVSLITAIQTGNDVSDEVRRVLRIGTASHGASDRLCDQVDRIAP